MNYKNYKKFSVGILLLLNTLYFVGCENQQAKEAEVAKERAKHIQSKRKTSGKLL